LSRLIQVPFNDAMVQAAIAEWDWPAHYYEERYYWPPDRTRRYQNARLKREVARASAVPFYQRLWERSGFDPSMFRGIEDHRALPLYTIEDIRESIALAPPYGDYQGAYPGPTSTSLRMYFSGGTTGKPRPTVYTPWDRMVSAMLSSRRRYREGPGQGTSFSMPGPTAPTTESGRSTKRAGTSPGLSPSPRPRET
jgi:phenylacetate-CoA ligase